ncbi:MAG: 4Fe-4S binding protein [Candidatus Muirbacterium halophilum]|nr:4Fe-4S binding protein [Candidatus Muirbacterium halophilum]
MPDSKNPIIYTNKANCRDCYRCVRKCPVHAIKMESAQASIIPDYCIYCGTCLRECPQKAKEYRNDTVKIRQIISENANVIVTIAPSYNSLFSSWEIKRIPSLMRKIGFSKVAETSIGALPVALDSATFFQQNKGAWISGACPVVVNLIKRYYPELVKKIIPIASPLIAHGRMLKNKYPNAKIVFIGPCIAKKEEIMREEHQGIIDAVMTFSELFSWIEEDKLDISGFEESIFDMRSSGINENMFPLSGGLTLTGNLTDCLESSETLHVTGINSIREILDNFSDIDKHIFIEPLFCDEGCISGPGIDREISNFKRKTALLENVKEQKNNNDLHREINDDNTCIVDLSTIFSTKEIPKTEFTDEEIEEVLEKTGKYSKEDYLDCGACGYNSCIEKAKAVLSGMAESSMCIPWMRKLAEKRSDIIMETSPNGIVIMNSNLEVIRLNKAFKEMFSCFDNSIGKRVSRVIDSDIFEKLIASTKNKIEDVKKFSHYGVVCHCVAYRIPEENLIAGIFVNITNTRNNQEKLKQIRENTVLLARELLEHQLTMSQNLAKFLGDNTAKSESLLNNLLSGIESPKK